MSGLFKFMLGLRNAGKFIILNIYKITFLVALIIAICFGWAWFDRYNKIRNAVPSVGAIVDKAGETKDAAAEKLGELKDSTAEKVEAVQDSTGNKLNEVRGAVDDKVSVTKDAVAGGVEATRERAGAVRDRTVEIKDAQIERGRAAAGSVISRLPTFGGNKEDQSDGEPDFVSDDESTIGVASPVALEKEELQGEESDEIENERIDMVVGGNDDCTLDEIDKILDELGVENRRRC